MKRCVGVILAAAALFVFGCDVIMGSDDPAGMGVLSVGFGDSGGTGPSGRSAIPSPAELAAMRYTLVLTGPGGQTRNVFLAPGQGFSEQAALGQWLIYAEAYDPGGELRGTGNASVTVKAGANQALVKMKAVEYVWDVTTIAGDGTGAWLDGPGLSAQFHFPDGITIDTSGNLYVADQSNHRIRMIANDGWVSTIAGTVTSGWLDGPGASAQFNFPYGITIDTSGNLYVADRSNCRIRMIANDGFWTVSTIAGTATPGFADGAGAVAQFDGPSGITIDSAGNLYVADMDNNRIRRIANDGFWTVSTIAGDGTFGFADGVGASAQFRDPYGITIDTSGNLYVADTNNNRIRRIANDGWVSTIAGTATPGFADGPGASAMFSLPYGITIDSAGNLYVVANRRIRKIANDGWVSTLAGDGTTGGFADGPGASAQFNFSHGITVDTSGNLYVADSNNNRIRKLTRRRVQ